MAAAEQRKRLASAAMWRGVTRRGMAMLNKMMGSRNGFDPRPRRIAKKSLRSRPVARCGTGRRPEPHETPGSGVACWFGATCEGVLLERMRLHLATQRFLAERRGDRIWEASCDYAALSLERLGARLRPGMFEQPLLSKKSRALSQNRKRCSRRFRRGAARGKR